MTNLKKEGFWPLNGCNPFWIHKNVIFLAFAFAIL